MADKGVAMMAATIRDVARKAGVSHTTVSNVVNNVPKVSEETRQRVLKAMAELGFEPNLAARSLYTKRSYLVGYMVPAITNEFFMNVARGAERVLYREGIGLFLCDTTLASEREADYLRRLIRHRVDGIIVNYVANRRTIHDAVRAGIPVVAIESPLGEPKISLVEVDNAGAAMLGVDHLTELGHRNIGVISIDFESDVNRERLRGFQNGLKLHDLQPRSDLLVSLSALIRENGYFDRTQDLTASPVAAHRELAGIVERLLKLEEPPTALFCFDYQSAMLVIRCLNTLGLAPGTDVSVLGFDAPNTVTVPRISAVTQPAAEMGSIAAELLLERVRDPKARPRSVRLSAQLTLGETTGPPAVR
ncbi:MAG: LacI family transcriptional regulator [Firmicutes bacterium]|jgi:DNA-binding LacI/PurR family transcriptional regulator|nr:LacI family transcriptional regulator [Bacillota bacterium]MDH7494412.1 LacI family DNA-binding transcriptional regulator [Bacillota bacterium]